MHPFLPAHEFETSLAGQDHGRPQSGTLWQKGGRQAAGMQLKCSCNAAAMQQKQRNSSRTAAGQQAAAKRQNTGNHNFRSHFGSRRCRLDAALQAIHMAW